MSDAPQTTASVSAPGEAPIRTIMDGYLTPGSLALLLGLVVSVLTITGSIRKTRRENEADARERADEIKEEFRGVHVSIAERVTKIEGRITDFMPRTEIEAKIDHEKANRLQAQAALKDVTDRLTGDVRTIMISQGKLEQQQAGFANDMIEIKSLLKEQSRDLKDIAAQTRAH